MFHLFVWFVAFNSIIQAALQVFDRSDYHMSFRLVDTCDKSFSLAPLFSVFKLSHLFTFVIARLHLLHWISYFVHSLYFSYIFTPRLSCSFATLAIFVLSYTSINPNIIFHSLHLNSQVSYLGMFSPTNKYQLSFTNLVTIPLANLGMFPFATRLVFTDFNSRVTEYCLLGENNSISMTFFNLL